MPFFTVYLVFIFSSKHTSVKLQTHFVTFKRFKLRHIYRAQKAVQTNVSTSLKITSK